MEEDGVLTATDPGSVATDDAVSTLLEAEALEQADPLAVSSHGKELVFAQYRPQKVRYGQHHPEGRLPARIHAAPRETEPVVWPCSLGRSHCRVFGDGFRLFARCMLHTQAAEVSAAGRTRASQCSSRMGRALGRRPFRRTARSPCLCGAAPRDDQRRRDEMRILHRRRSALGVSPPQAYLAAASASYTCMTQRTHTTHTTHSTHAHT